jgi:hypothetical protein
MLCALLFDGTKKITKLYATHSVQNEDGGWGTQVLGPSTMFGSCLNYVTLRLLDEVDNNALTKGRAWILSRGSAAAIPQWGKIWLSVCHGNTHNLVCIIYVCLHV